MRIVGVGFAFVFVVSSFFSSAQAQQAVNPADAPVNSASGADSSTPASAIAAPAQSASSLPPTFNDILDRVVQREHLFMAQMRHMHPMVETYLQDLKNDSEGNAVPAKDQYFLGRLDMSDGSGGPEDVSFVGQPGFGHRMVTKLTGVYSLHYLPMGFAQMVVLDS